jgi:hypothetical protein
MERKKVREVSDEAEVDESASPKCPQCGLVVEPGAIRCPRCRAFLLRACSGSCASCGVAGCATRKS